MEPQSIIAKEEGGIKFSNPELLEKVNGLQEIINKKVTQVNDLIQLQQQKQQATNELEADIQLISDRKLRNRIKNIFVQLQIEKAQIVLINKEDCEKQIPPLKKQLEGLSENIKSLNQKLDEKSEAIKKLHPEKGKLEMDYDNKKFELEKKLRLVTRDVRSEEEMKELVAVIGELRESIKQSKESVARRREEINRLNREIQEAQAKR